jgi:hypothetical protein
MSGKTIVAGIINQLNIIKARPPQSAEGPQMIDPRQFYRAGAPFCYIYITGVHGHLPLELRYLDLHDNSVLMDINFNFDPPHPDPIQSYELIIPTPMLPVPHPGAYVLELLTNNELIGSYRITAKEQQPREEM